MSENEKITIGNESLEKKEFGGSNVSPQFTDTEFQVPTEEVELPSLGRFYKNGKKTVKIKYLTAEEDDVLYSPELIKSGKVLDALLQVIVVDKDIAPEDMIVGDRNAILIHARRIGIGEDYKPGKMTCPSCNEQYDSHVNLNDLKMKFLENEPDVNGEYDFLLPIMKKNIKFRMLTGRDENRITKMSQVSNSSIKKGDKQNLKVSKSVTEKYRLQIMEVEGNRDKLYISRLISAMPMRDSAIFREYAKEISPGVDFNYNFTCTNCGHQYEGEVPINIRLFYPDADI